MKKMIPSEIIHVDENGNLEIDGATKLSGGLEPIHEYTFNDGGDIRKLGVFFETYLSFINSYDFIGYIADSDGAIELCFGQYSIENGQLKEMYAWYFYDTQEKPVIETWSSSENSSNYYYPALENNTQAKLYRHKLTLNNLYILMYNSTNNLEVDSVTDLRNIMKISASREEILPVCASDATSMVTLVVTDSLCQVDGTDVTTVSDVVTPL